MEQNVFAAPKAEVPYGWRVLKHRTLNGADVMARGRDIPGCASFRQLPNGSWDVALYHTSPAQIRLGMDAKYVELEPHNSLLFEVANLVRRELV